MGQSPQRSSKTRLKFKEMDFPFLNFFLDVILFFCTSMFIILPEDFVHYWGHSLLFVVF